MPKVQPRYDAAYDRRQLIEAWQQVEFAQTKMESRKAEYSEAKAEKELALSRFRNLHREIHGGHPLFDEPAANGTPAPADVEVKAEEGVTVDPDVIDAEFEVAGVEDKRPLNDRLPIDDCDHQTLIADGLPDCKKVDYTGLRRCEIKTMANLRGAVRKDPEIEKWADDDGVVMGRISGAGAARIRKGLEAYLMEKAGKI